MLRILGGQTTAGKGAPFCDRVTRRELMRVGGLSLFGSMTLPALLQAREAAGARRASAKAKSVVMFNLLGGPSHMDMFDMKPEAPADIRGQFQPIATSVPGLHICEYLPRIAQLMHKATLIRTFSHNFNSHDPLPIMTGFTDDKNLAPAMPTDPPDIGAICQYLGLGPRDLPGAVCMPNYPGQSETPLRRRGPYGGFLGQQYDPMFSTCAPTFAHEPKQAYYAPVMPMGDVQLPALEEIPGMTSIRLQQRRSLLTQLDERLAAVEASGAVDNMHKFQQRAFDLLSTSRTREAFDISQETVATRDRYGRNVYGSSMLVARRLVEAGVPFISVHQAIFGHYGHSYDMHANNFSMLKDFNLPLLDTLIPALVEDLEMRGLLDSTLIVVMGEMGRSPRINGAAGRDHWPQCGFSLLIGGGVKQGHVHGRTDKQAGYPVSDPVSPPDFVATIYHLLGIDPRMTVLNHSGRPMFIAHGGEVVQGVLA